MQSLLKFCLDEEDSHWKATIRHLRNWQSFLSAIKSSRAIQEDEITVLKSVMKSVIKLFASGWTA